jgi:Sec-independent protein translocase protein TatA
MFDFLHPTHLLFVVLVALAVFGPKRLVEMSRNLGLVLRDIQAYKAELKEEVTSATSEVESDKKHSPEKEG